MEAIREAFRAYYREHSSLLFVPEASSREFMVVDFDGMVKRHMSLQNLPAVRWRLIAEAPRHAYYSVALYKRPDSRDMEGKGLESAELLFDIDADQLGVECRADHDLWKCKDCNTGGRWPAPSLCPECGSERIGEMKWICPTCLGASKREVFKLIEILTSDLRIREEEIIVAYTGHRGYHVRVRNPEAMKLGKKERREIAELTLARGLDPGLLVGVRRGASGLHTSSVGEGGWRGRFARGIKDALDGNPPGWINERRADYLRSIPGLKEAITVGSGIPHAGPKVSRVLREIAREMAAQLGVKADEEVTSDPHRFTRMPNSLHGKTGLRALTLGPVELEGFNPLNDALGLKGSSLRVKVTEEVPRFSIGGESFGPFGPTDEVSLPIQASAFIILKGRGVSA